MYVVSILIYKYNNMQEENVNDAFNTFYWVEAGTEMRTQYLPVH